MLTKQKEMYFWILTAGFTEIASETSAHKILKEK